ncbi:unnamed protein product [Ilex paraguariensis]|uniref:Uncharacterized protein n=1 Tax=Ilex paraguariensis TaxID=185542 RepID=A0ABC8RYP9_9AQUA
MVWRRRGWFTVQLKRFKPLSFRPSLFKPSSFKPSSLLNRKAACCCASKTGFGSEMFTSFESKRCFGF